MKRITLADDEAHVIECLVRKELRAGATGWANPPKTVMGILRSIIGLISEEPSHD